MFSLKLHLVESAQLFFFWSHSRCKWKVIASWRSTSGDSRFFPSVTFQVLMFDF